MRCCAPNASDRRIRPSRQPRCDSKLQFTKLQFKGIPAMTAIGWIQIFLFCAVIVALTKPLGWYMTRVFEGERTPLSPLLRPIEVAIYWVGGVDEKREQH